MTRPCVSIGMPVYNGEQFIRDAIDSILAQTFTDFELIISDNASTDRTPEICRAYAAKDKRIRYYQNQKNKGAAWNYNHVFALAKGEYFKWAAHDDVLAPEFLARCVEVLEKHPSVVLCHAKVRFINAQGNMLADYTIKLKTQAKKPHRRFAALIRMHHWCFDVFGLIRADALKKTPLIGAYIGSDRPLLAELGLAGRFYEIPEYLWFSRQHAKQSVKIRLHERAGWFDPAKEKALVFPYWRTWLEYLKAVQRVELPWAERVHCYPLLGRWLLTHMRFLLKDVLLALRQLRAREPAKARMAA